MSSDKKCIFCGKPFAGQRKNFEHIVPRWLVVEADLSRRDMDVNLPGQSRKIGMGRIGIKVCETCNNDGASLEADAKSAYISLVNGDELEDDQIVTLLDWLDKIRIGMWLWLVEQTKSTAGIQPKFRVNQRIGSKDRLFFVQRYPPGPLMRGLAFAGIGPYFLGLPGSFGMLINNVYIGSASGDFLVLRHIRDVRIQIAHGKSDLDELEIISDFPNERRLKLLGNPSVFAQCIMPTDEFRNLSVPIKSPSVMHIGWSESHIVRLDLDLREWSKAPKGVPLTEIALRASTTLMAINVEEVAAFIFHDWKLANTENMSDEKRAKVGGNIDVALDQINFVKTMLKFDYFKETGLRLPD